MSHSLDFNKDIQGSKMLSFSFGKSSWHFEEIGLGEKNSLESFGVILEKLRV